MSPGFTPFEENINQKNQLIAKLRWLSNVADPCTVSFQKVTDFEIFIN